MKTVKVITVCFKDRVAHGSFDGDNRKELDDSQSALSMIREVVEYDRTIDAGTDMDTIIVNNDLGYDEGRNYLDTIKGTKTKNGLFKVMHRPNVGRSFGGYNEAFNKYKDEYDYWIFSEDDLYYCKDGYAKNYIDILNSNENCAFVATLGVDRADHETKHAHGGQGLTHRDYMEETIPLEYSIDDGTNRQAYKIKGELAHYHDKSVADSYHTRLHCIHGEVPFTYSLVRLGYDILVDDNPKSWYKIYDN